MADPTDTFREMMLEARMGRAATAEKSLVDLDEKIERSEARWSEAELRDTISKVLADSIREAGETDHEALARAIAPHILNTVRGEIGNAHPEIIEALSPRLGELIRAAVTKSVEDLQRQIDEAVPVDLWIATVKAKITGTSATGWVLRDEAGFEVLEAYLIERGSGLLLARDRPAPVEGEGDELDDDLLAGMIAALDSFAQDAFGGSGIETLRELTLSMGTIYLRASPTKILALRCTGVAGPKIEEEIDRLLDRVIRRLDEDGPDLTPARLLAEATAPEEEKVSAGALVGKALAGIAAALLLVWGHFALEEGNRDRWTEAVERTAAADPALAGYPLAATHDPAIGAIRLTGLVPDEAARDAIEARLARIARPLPTVLAVPVAGRRLVE